MEGSPGGGIPRGGAALAAPAERLRSRFLGGVKHMQTRYRLAPPA